MILEFDETTHTYQIDGRPAPSVTQIIAETIGGGWMASEWFLQRGRVTHKCAELIGKGIDFKFDERIAGEVSALRKFFAEVKPEIICSEFRVCSALHGFAGTLDLLCKIGTKNVIIDFKHSVDKIRMPLQLGGYAVALSETDKREFKFGSGVHIDESGKYTMTEIIDLTRSKNQFLALNTTYKIKEKCGSLTSQQKKEA